MTAAARGTGVGSRALYPCWAYDLADFGGVGIYAGQTN